LEHRQGFFFRVMTALVAALKEWLRVTTLAGLSVAVGFPWIASASNERPEEAHVKAAFLYNFAKFVQWPTPDRRPDALSIGVVGGDRFRDVLGSIVNGKTVNGRDIEVRQVLDDDDVLTYHIIFIAAAESRRATDVIQRVARAGVLTVGETPQFLQEGGVIQFYVRDNHVRFQINAAAANNAGLKISSQLLSLSKQ
jgi:hypothetical protein